MKTNTAHISRVPGRTPLRVLYISYDGMLEPLGQSQVLRYLERLAVGNDIWLISYEKADDWAKVAERKAMQKSVSDAGIHWMPLRYHKRPSALATAFDIFQGIVVAGYLTLKYRVEIIHARSYVASLIALVLKKLFRLKFIFDMRGFWADERVEGGLWPEDSRLYRIAKGLERKFLLCSDRVVSLTQAAVDEMSKFPYLQGHMPVFEVITTCADLDLFRPDAGGGKSQNEGRPFNLGYVGSVGVSYLFDETLQCFKLLRQVLPDAQLHILNRYDHAYIRERLDFHKIDVEAVRLEATDHAGVARAMCRMDAGIFFVKQTYSKMASAPTKLGEFLGCGVPCLSNVGVGDMAAILEGEEVGVVLKNFSEAEMRAGIARMLKLSREPDIGLRCRQAGLKHFSLETGVRKYAEVYAGLLGESGA